MSLEVVVRPIVLPDIRPPAARRIAPPDDPTKGLCVLGGGGSGTFIGTSTSQTVNMSKQKPHRETRRQVDVERIYQMTDAPAGGSRAADGGSGGAINRNNYIDVERMKKVRSEAKDGGSYQTLRTIFADPPEERPNVEVLETDKEIKAGD